MTYVAAPDRYERTNYRRCGQSGIKLPPVSLGLWQNSSLRRMGLDYVDIFYSHRADLGTPLEGTMGALATAVQSGKGHQLVGHF